MSDQTLMAETFLTTSESLRAPNINLSITKEARIAMTRHMVSDPSNEVCGFILGAQEPPAREAGIVYKGTGYVPINNIAPNKQALFIMDPYQILNAMEKYAGKIIGCYHTHPYWTGRPSGTDFKQAQEFEDKFLWVIHGGADNIDMAHYFMFTGPNKTEPKFYPAKLTYIL